MRYRDEKTGEIHVTVDDSAKDKRLAKDPDRYKKVTEKQLASAQAKAETPQAEAAAVAEAAAGSEAPPK
jgi:hypothetical protein